MSRRQKNPPGTQSLGSPMSPVLPDRSPDRRLRVGRYRVMYDVTAETVSVWHLGRRAFSWPIRASSYGRAGMRLFSFVAAGFCSLLRCARWRAAALAMRRAWIGPSRIWPLNWPHIPAKNKFGASGCSGARLDGPVRAVDRPRSRALLIVAAPAAHTAA
jgi:hypothetical protein